MQRPPTATPSRARPRPGAVLRVVRLHAFLLALIACNEALAPNTRRADPSDAGAPSFVSTAAYTEDYSWSQGQPPTLMKTNGPAVCLLTRVSGDFDGGGEYVRTYVQDGMWYLGGSSKQSGVSARARCINSPSFSTDYYVWTTGPLWRQKLPGPPFTCGLTGVRGKFEDGVDLVQIESHPDGWSLVALSGSGGLVQGWARCFTGYANRYAQPVFLPPSYSSSLYLGSLNKFCFLAGMRGHFEGGGESVRVYKARTGWRLEAASKQSGVGGMAQCVW